MYTPVVESVTYADAGLYEGTLSFILRVLNGGEELTSHAGIQIVLRNASTGAIVGSEMFYNITFPLTVTFPISSADAYSYMFIKIYSQAGGSAFYDSAVFAAANTSPGAPTNVSIAGDVCGAVISWGAPINNGGTAITDYRLTYVLSSGGASNNISLGATPQNDLFVTLSPETYDFSIYAVNAIGDGASVSTSNVVVAAPAQASGPAPTITSVIANADGTVDIQWSYDAQGPAIKFNIYATKGGNTYSYMVTGSTERSYKITGLPGGSYSIQVGAVDGQNSEVGSNLYGPVSVTATIPPSSGGVVCFFGNAPVLTPAGYRRMDSLRAGDKVTTPEGRVVAIEAVKVTRCAAGAETNPYVIPKGEFGATKKLLISPRHRVATPKGMVEARHLGLEQEERTGSLTYYNLSLPGWSNMIVAGVEVESLAPVKRVVVPVATFKQMISRKYGTMTPAVAEMIRGTCRFTNTGEVECPVMRR